MSRGQHLEQVVVVPADASTREWRQAQVQSHLGPLFQRQRQYELP
jgi:hypothetical protein